MESNGQVCLAYRPTFRRFKPKLVPICKRDREIANSVARVGFTLAGLGIPCPHPVSRVVMGNWLTGFFGHLEAERCNAR